MNGYLLCVNTHAPYHNSAATDAFEAAIAATNVGLEVKLLFQHDGVYQLLDTQNPQQINHKNIFKKLKSLSFFDIDEIYVDQKSIDLRGLRITNEELSWQSLGKDDMIKLVDSAQQILVF